MLKEQSPGGATEYGQGSSPGSRRDAPNPMLPAGRHRMDSASPLSLGLFWHIFRCTLAYISLFRLEKATRSHAKYGMLMRTAACIVMRSPRPRAPIRRCRQGWQGPPGPGHHVYLHGSHGKPGEL